MKGGGAVDVTLLDSPSELAAAFTLLEIVSLALYVMDYLVIVQPPEPLSQRFYPAVFVKGHQHSVATRYITHLVDAHYYLSGHL